jgi:DNA helicase-2/ATP-dependent DNA helicase PcrA
MDFDDLLLKMHEMLHSQPDALSKYQRKFKYIMIDEYQDTNAVQYQIAKLLAAMNENICVVGDDAQSIYSFRGATIENILQFQKDYDEVKIVKLEQNYRSTQSIIKVANEVISNNKDQIPKNLWTDNQVGEKIKIVRTMTDNDEGKFVADCIQEQKLRNHYFNRDFAILYRTNAQSRAYEESLRRLGIAYRIYGGLSFYQRKEVKDMLAYLRIIVNTRDEEALKRIINYPVRGIGKTSIEKLVIISNEQNITLFESISRSAEFGFKGGTLETLQNFVTMIRYFQSILNEKNAYDVALQVGKHTNLVKELFADKSTEGIARYENVQELLNSIKNWTEMPDNEDGELLSKDLGAFLQQVTLFTDADEDKENSDVVKLMTIHAAKGLEFGCVFVGGVEENLFPNAMSVNTREELEEERRLFYVAVTRAKDKLWLTHANARYRFGQLAQNDPSRFLDEMPEQFLDKTYSGGGMKNQGSQGNMGIAFERMHRGMGGNASHNVEAKSKPSFLHTQPVAPKIVEHKPTENFVPSDTSNLQAGQEVEHQKFGFGKVISVEGSAHNPVANIHFKLNGEKKIMLNYAKLRIL